LPPHPLGRSQLYRHLSTSNNLVYNCQQQVLYTVAALVVVYDKPSHTQRFFQGHDDDVTCLALAPDKRVAASGQLGKDPVVLVWDSLTLATLQRLQHGWVAALVFACRCCCLLQAL
jgi:microtubule-associated protein-like 6